MNRSFSPYIPIFLLMGVLLVALVLYPSIDRSVSRFFYDPQQGFIGDNSFLADALTATAYHAGRFLALALVAAVLWCWLRKTSLFHLETRAWAFLLLALVLGPALMANAIFKDHWGRARPRQTTEFGGMATFSPPLVIANQCEKNCSFVSGDGSFGFFLPSLAYVVSDRRKKKTFWISLGIGSLFGIGRITSGAHFLSDVLFAGVFTFVTTAIAHALIYGKRETQVFWKRIVKS